MLTKILITLIVAAFIFLIRSKLSEKSLKEQNKELNDQLKDAQRLSVVRDQTKAKSVQPGNRGYQPRKVLRPENQTVPTQRQEVDRMKRKNIQPGNQGLVPVGAIQDVNGHLRESNINKKQNLQHKFFGTQLELGGRVLINGLAKGVHNLEVIEGELYVDHKPVKIHPNDVDALIHQIKETK